MSGHTAADEKHRPASSARQGSGTTRRRLVAVRVCMQSSFRPVDGLFVKDPSIIIGVYGECAIKEAEFTLTSSIDLCAASRSMASKLSEQALLNMVYMWDNLKRIKPLVQCITNYVSMVYARLWVLHQLDLNSTSADILVVFCRILWQIV